MAIGLDPNSPTALNARHLSEIAGLFAKARDFVDRVYIPDVLAVASFYKDWAGIGAGIGNYLAYGDFPEDDSGDPKGFYLPRGRILGRDLATIHPVDHTGVAETVAHSWYEYPDGDEAHKHPWEGETNPKYAGPTPPFDSLEGHDKYSWLKAPRFEDQPMEVGPLARMLVAYGSGHADVKAAVDTVLASLGVGAEALFSTLGRIAARAIETQLLAARLPVWLAELEANLKSGDLAIADVTKWDPATWPADAKGWGMEEAPRGALGHWVVIKDQKIENYQLVVPSTWNGSPRDEQGRRGAWEEALIGTPVEDPTMPVEILRTVHSFDPCMACAVHVFDPTGGSSVEIRIL
jgi:[NiFe] hydrogenase large subunit/hydrogenase large subunit